MISINFDQFYSELKQALKDKKPWSHIRYGDGEGIVMGYPDFTKEHRAKARWHKWLGDCELIHIKDRMKRFGFMVRQSILNADIIGIPCLRHQTVNSDWRNVKKFMDYYKLIKENTKCCCMDCTVDLQKKGLYRELLKDQDVIVISCRGVTQQLQEVTGRPVLSILLPPQQKPNLGPILTKKKHYPELYQSIIKFLNSDQDFTGKLFLIGAGGLGKLYCDWAKSKGAMALDIGSIFDGWVGLITRSYLKDIGQFKL
jgi:hypothetical protein